MLLQSKKEKIVFHSGCTHLLSAANIKKRGGEYSYVAMNTENYGWMCGIVSTAEIKVFCYDYALETDVRRKLEIIIGHKSGGAETFICRGGFAASTLLHG
jgi:hypothetical protein